MGSRLEKNSNEVRKRIENHTFENEEGEEYKGSAFGGFSDYFRRKKIKLQNLDTELRSQSTDNPSIFRGIVVHVNGYTQPSLNDLHRLIVSHGGGFMQYLDGKTTVTHIVASSLTPKKVVDFKNYRIVKPAWIVHSVNAGRLLPWDSYRVVDEGAAQKILQFDDGKISAQVNQKQRGYRDQTDQSWYTNQFAESAGEKRPLLSEIDTAHLDAQHLQISGKVEIVHDEVATSSARGDVTEDATIARIAQIAEPLDVQLHRQGAPIEKSQETTHYASVASNETKNFIPNPHVPIDLQQLEDEDLNSSSECLDPPEQENKSLVLEISNHEDLSPTTHFNLTAEEHNAKLLADPYIRKLSTANPDFLEQFYRESRLHHLSTWKADLKSQLQALTAEKSLSQKTRQRRPTGARRYVLHVDFDSFFVAVSLKKYPQYANKPAVVAHGQGSGSEIASCNYPARKFGVKNGMWMRRAYELCKDLKVLPYDFPEYEAASRIFYDAILATEGTVQSVSIDEALVDVTVLCLEAGRGDGVTPVEGSTDREQAKADEIAQRLRDHVKERTGCAVSVGIGNNILLAKCALRKAKPAGQYQVKPEEVLDFLGPLEVRALPGVAYSIGGKLEELGIKLVKDIREVSKEKLVTTLGPKTGDKLWNYARGIDRTEVGDQVIRKSVSAEVSWGVRFETQAQAEEFLDCLCDELSKRLLKESVKGRHLTMKIMKRATDAPLDPPKHLGHGKCDTFNKSVMLGVATNVTEAISKEAIPILRSYGFSPGELRGLGVQMQKLEPIKSTSVSAVEGSQRRLQFKPNAAGGPFEQQDVDPIQESSETSKKPKQAMGAFVALANSPSRKPLNTLGTQFIMPTQVDPEVLEALPEDIRAQLSRPLQSDDQNLDENIASKSGGRPAGFIMPNLSQLDPETLEALGDDLKAEILAYYDQPNKSNAQSVLPQSPRKIRSVPISKRPSTTRGRGRGSLSRFKNSSRDDNTLTQSNFVTTAKSNSRQGSHDPFADVDGEEHASTEDDRAEVDPEVLAALPEDMRLEILADQRSKRLQRTSGLDLSRKRPRRRPPQPQSADQVPSQRLLTLEPRPPKPTFSQRHLCDVADLREAVKVWIEEFRDDGPYPEDVNALAKYLRRVVEEERDMSKAARVVKWMTWVVEQETMAVRDQSKARWARALGSVRDSVQDAVRARGLGDVDL